MSGAFARDMTFLFAAILFLGLVLRFYYVAVVSARAGASVDGGRRVGESGGGARGGGKGIAYAGWSFTANVRIGCDR